MASEGASLEELRAVVDMSNAGAVAVSEEDGSSATDVALVGVLAALASQTYEVCRRLERIESAVRRLSRGGAPE